MKKLATKFAMVTLVVLGSVSASIAHEFRLGDIEIGHPYTRAMLPRRQGRRGISQAHQ